MDVQNVFLMDIQKLFKTLSPVGIQKHFSRTFFPELFFQNILRR